jgi:6-phosphogluconolactonase (cycloisomerase 2 family)
MGHAFVNPIPLRKTVLQAIVLAIACSTIAVAKIPEPDHVFYGTPTHLGQPVATGTVTAKLEGDDTVLATYELGSNPTLGGRYALRIPIDAVDPRAAGTARPGDAIQFFIDDVLAGSGTVGARGEVTALDLDPLGGGLPSLSVNDVSAYETNGGTVNFVFTVTLSSATASDVTFEWSTANGTAQAGIDYVQIPAGTHAQVNAGDLTTQLTVVVNGDTFQEDNDTFFVNLVNVSGNAVLFDGQGLGTILDDDRPPAISIADVAVTEGDSGAGPAQFTLTLSRPVPQTITVNWATAPGTATANVDYQTNAGLATFTPNTTSTNVVVQVVGDLDDENDETFQVNLSGATAGAVINDAQGIGTILDDDGFLTFIEAEGLGLLEGLYGASSVAVSPDGAHVYATGQYDDGIVAFSRNGVNGALTYLFNLKDSQVQGLNTIDGLDGADSVAISPDGAHVYVAGFNDNGVAVFARNAVTGDLTFLAVYKDTVGGSPDGLLGAASLVVSPDGAHVYVAGSSDDAIAVFARDHNPISPTFGKLTYVEAKFDGVGGVDGLDGAQWVRLSPNGAHLYVASGVDKAVAVFSRNAGTGALTFVQAAKDGIGGVNGLDGASSVAVSPDGANVYATGATENALVTFNRNGATGAITFVSMLADGVAGVEGLAGATAVTPSFDARYVYVAGFFDDALAVFHRDVLTGALSFLEVEKDGFGGVDGLARVTNIAVSPDDQHVYATGQNDDAVAVFMRDAIAPVPPSLLTSTSHVPSVFSNDPTVDVEWSGATDNPGGSGLAGYSFIWDTTPLTVPDGVIELAHTVDPHQTTSPPLPDGTSYYFHIRTCDLVGNCSAAQHLGPYFIDSTNPIDPSLVISTSHVVSTPTPDPTIDMQWSPASDALSGVDGYAIAFDGSSSNSCDHGKDLEEGATTTTSATLADGTWYFHICTRDNAGNWTGGKTAGPYIVEAQPPRVTAIDTVAGTGDHALLPGEETASAITQIRTTFSEPISDPVGNSDPDDVTNPANHQLFKAGVNGVLDTTVCGPAAGDDVAVAVNGVIYDAATRTATASVNGGFGLPASLYRLLVCGTTSVVDLYGHPLDGDGNGTGGDEKILDFQVDATNQLRNPNFDGNLANWAALPPTPGVVVYSGLDADGTPTSGSGEMLFLSGTPFYSVSQCVPVDDTSSYTWGGRVRTAGGGVGTPIAFAEAQFYSSTNCTTGPLGSEVTSTSVAGDTGGSWSVFNSAVTAPPVGARSAYVSFVVDGTSAPAFDSEFDNVYFRGPSGGVFVDGFETGNFAQWSAHVP